VLLLDVFWGHGWNYHHTRTGKPPSTLRVPHPDVASYASVSAQTSSTASPTNASRALLTAPTDGCLSTQRALDASPACPFVCHAAATHTRIARSEAHLRGTSCPHRSKVSHHVHSQLQQTRSLSVLSAAHKLAATRHDTRFLTSCRRHHQDKTQRLPEAATHQKARRRRSRLRNM